MYIVAGRIALNGSLWNVIYGMIVGSSVEMNV